MSLTPIHTIVTHYRPHLDEIMAILLLDLYGGQEFPGTREVIRRGNIVFWDAGSLPPDGRTAEDWERDGYLLVGVGQGRFDEHPGPGRGRLKGETATSLVAKFLKKHRESYLYRLLNYVRDTDLQGEPHPQALARLVDDQHTQYPNDPLRVMRWTMDVLRGIIFSQSEFGRTHKVVENATIVTGAAANGFPWRIVILETDLVQAKKRALSDREHPATVAVTRNGRGQVQVFFSGKFKIDPLPIVAGIRQAELEHRGVEGQFDLAQEGALYPGDIWHFFPSMPALFNGTLTAPNTAATGLSLDFIVETVKQGLEDQAITIKEPAETPA